MTVAVIREFDQASQAAMSDETGACESPKPEEFMGFGATHDSKPYKLLGFGDT